MATAHYRPNEPVLLAPPVDLVAIDPFRVESFPDLAPQGWLDQPDAESQVDRMAASGELDARQAHWCRQWLRHGYVVIEGMFDEDTLDAAWQDYEDAIESGDLHPEQDHGARVDNPLPGRVLNPHFKLEAFRSMLFDARACELVSMLFGAKALPFQTIAGHKGSEQKAHSDSIHMTTHPQGFLAANWIAFEDIRPDSGPLEFFPGSHRLPYTYSRDCGIALDEGRRGYEAYHAKYEPHIQGLIAQHQLKPEYFLARKGDVLFWHANLIHGGSPIANPATSRRALVCHYFAEGCVCYHDYTGTSSHLVRLPMVPRERFDAGAYLRANPDVAAAGVDAYAHYQAHGHAEGRALR